jgi:hypothetical protein
MGSSPNNCANRSQPDAEPVLLRDCGQALAAFWQDMGDRMADVAVVPMSEFGRTAHKNGNRGADHGHANCMFVMGGSQERQGVREVARPGKGATLRRPRPGAHHGFPRRPRRAGVAPPGESHAPERFPGYEPKLLGLV